MDDSTKKIMRRRTEHVRDISVADLVKEIGKFGPVDPANVIVTGTHLLYFSEETDEEFAARLDLIRRQKERQEKYDRETYQRLKAKYEDRK